MDFYKLAWCDSTTGTKYDPETVGVTMRETEMTEFTFMYRMSGAKDPGLVCTKNLGPTQISQFNTYI